MVAEQKSWFVVRTRPRWEKKVSKQFNIKGVESYCPLNKVQRQWSDRKKIVFEPLFSSYVFVKSSVDKISLLTQFDGVLGFIYWLKKPAVVSNEEIDVIKRFMNDYSDVTLEKSAVSLNAQVKITGGPLMHREGKVLEILHKTIKVVLPSLGFTIVVELEKSNVQLIPTRTYVDSNLFVEKKEPGDNIAI